MHGPDAGVGAFLQTVLQRRRGSFVIPPPDAADIAWSIWTVVVSAVIIMSDSIKLVADEFTGEDAVFDGGAGCQTVGHDATGVVVVEVEGGIDSAALDEVCTVGKAHKARQVHLLRGDGALYG